ncbi:zinc-finger domain-containing protein [Schinkia sp. CFF1]
MSICGQAVDKQKEKKVRDKIIRILDGNCTNCFTKLNNNKLYGSIKAHKYCIETCEVGKKLQQLGELIGKEKNPLWSKDEVQYLLNHYQLYSIDHLAKRLGRTPEAVEIKLKRYLSRRKNKNAGTV